MIRRRLFVLVLVLLGTGAPLADAIAASGMVTEVIPVGYRPVEEVIAILRPMVPKPGSVSGAYGKLVVRTTPENMREIKEILATLDRAPANLLVSVRHSMNEEVKRDLLETFGEVGGSSVEISTGRDPSGGGLIISSGDDDRTAGVRIDSTRSSTTDSGTQRVRVLEGKEAFIRSGQSVPVTDERVVISSSGTTTVQRSTSYRTVDSGFYVRVRLGADNNATVEVFPQQSRLDSGSGIVAVREASTVVSAPLGRWMEIGGVSSSFSDSTRELGATSSGSGASESATYLKVERLDR